MAEAQKPTLFVAGFSVEFLNGDQSYLVTVFYKNEEDQVAGTPDKFSFSTAAKLKKFITKHLVTAGETADEPAAEEAAE